MAGQLIVLPGVTAAASANAPRINMNAADTLAARISSLKHAAAARAMTAVSGGGVTGRCRVTGQPLISKGTSPKNLSLTEVSGKKALAAGANSGLALPNGSLTTSYTVVAAVALASADVSASGAVNLLAGFSPADDYTSLMLRYYGSLTASPNTDVFMAAGPVITNTAVVRAARPAGAWAIVVIDFSDSQLLSLAVNQAATFATLQRSSSPVIVDGSYLELGYHPSSGLANSKIGDIYTFNGSLLTSDLGKSQLAELVAAMKSVYGIA